MIRAWRDRHPGNLLWRVVWWQFLRLLCKAWLRLCYRFHTTGAHHIPEYGPVLFVSNHQSFLDPIVLGVGSYQRQFRAMTRATLFDNLGLAWLLRSLHTIPVDQENTDTAAIRKSIQALKQKQALLIFPEGARTYDGSIGPFSRGMMLLIHRAAPVVVPVAIEGAFTAWPRDRALPRLTGNIGVSFGAPIRAQDLNKMGHDAALVYLREIIERLRADLVQT